MHKGLHTFFILAGSALSIVNPSLLRKPGQFSAL